MKPSQMFDTFKKVLELGSHAHSLSDFAGIFFNREPSADAPAIVKGLHGIFGKADERALQVLLHKLEEEKPGSVDVLAGFFSWHFKTKTTNQKMLSWWYGNAFRSYVTQMGSSAGHVEGSEETVAEKYNRNTRAKEITTTKRELRGKGTDNSLNFLKMMVDVIESESDRIKGYKKLLVRFEAFGIPHIPRSTEKGIHSIVNKTIALADAGKQEYRRAKVAIANDTQQQEVRLNERQVKKSWLRKILID